MRVLQEAMVHIVTIQTITKVTRRDDMLAHLENIYIRGSQICLLILPPTC